MTIPLKLKPGWGNRRGTPPSSHHHLARAASTVARFNDAQPRLATQRKSACITYTVDPFRESVARIARTLPREAGRTVVFEPALPRAAPLLTPVRARRAGCRDRPPGPGSRGGRSPRWCLPPGGFRRRARAPARPRWRARARRCRCGSSPGRLRTDARGRAPGSPGPVSDTSITATAPSRRPVMRTWSRPGILGVAALERLHRVAREVEQDAEELVGIGVDHEAALDRADPAHRRARRRARASRARPRPAARARSDGGRAAAPARGRRTRSTGRSRWRARARA